MTRSERWLFNGLSLVVTTSGFAYLWMKYGLEPPDPFAVVNHPWQSAMLHAHILASPPFILVFGVILHSHVMRKLKATGLPNRWSGYLSLGTFVAMLTSGYLLQVGTTERLLAAMVATHLASAVLFTAAYATHLVVSLALVRRRSSLLRPREAA